MCIQIDIKYLSFPPSRSLVTSIHLIRCCRRGLPQVPLPQWLPFGISFPWNLLWSQPFQPLGRSWRYGWATPGGSHFNGYTELDVLIIFIFWLWLCFCAWVFFNSGFGIVVMLAIFIFLILFCFFFLNSWATVMSHFKDIFKRQKPA